MHFGPCLVRSKQLHILLLTDAEVEVEGQFDHSTSKHAIILAYPVILYGTDVYIEL